MKTTIITAIAMLFPLLINAADSLRLNRGPGIYPGNPNEDFSPTLAVSQTPRNVALNRIATASSSYDYNLTAQLATDGIVYAGVPMRLDVSTAKGLLPKREREWSIDGGKYSENVLAGPKAYIQYDWSGMKISADKIKIICRASCRENMADNPYHIRAMVSADGTNWQLAGEKSAASLSGKPKADNLSNDPNKERPQGQLGAHSLNEEIALNVSQFSHLRIEFEMKGGESWALSEVEFSLQGKPLTSVLPSSKFCSAWMSAGGGEEWIKVDFGAKARFNKIISAWIDRPAKGIYQVSDDGKTWRDIDSVKAGKTNRETVACNDSARYLRILMLKPDSTGRYALSEIAVMGKGGLVAVPRKAQKLENLRLSLDGGNWKLQRASQVIAKGEAISSPKYDAKSWITATVPATVLTSYVNVGAVPNPNYADNINHISESFFNSDFWYRRTFTMPKLTKKHHVFLNFDGINWKAEIYLNGKKISRIEGAFAQSKTDVSKLIVAGVNVLAVKIIKNAHIGAVKEKDLINPDKNGGMLGADNPTFHATIGWDWIPTMRGRDAGIWNDVYITLEGSVSLSGAAVKTELTPTPDKLATMTPSVILKNNEPRSVSGKLQGWIGNLKFEKNVTLNPNDSAEIVFNPDETAILLKKKMRLWWPNGYGEPYLYDAGFVFGGDTLRYKAGIRQVETKDALKSLKLYVNGVRIVPRGGNWGFSEASLNYRAREYDAAVAYHKDMNFNMIRNWVGQTGDEEFYEACDKYGIMVWQDFWLANPADGPDPDDEKLFLDNARSYILRIRNHSSVVLYCGRNEGYPPLSLDTRLREYVKALNYDLPYISSSADDGVSGHGPYRAMPEEYYFSHQSGKLHSECGMPNIMTIESLKRTFAVDNPWPQNDQWGQHDFTMKGAQGGESFNKLVERAFGKVESAEKFSEYAQWINYNGYRAMYEADSKYRTGLLIWMSHSCWPSLTWTTYDYFLNPGAAYFACKKACEPLHIQYNAATSQVEVVNITPRDYGLFNATAAICTPSGKPMKQEVVSLGCGADTTIRLQKILPPEDYQGAYLIVLSLKDKAGKEVSRNIYAVPDTRGSLKQFISLPKAEIAKDIRVGDTRAVVKLKNNSQIPAVMIRLNLKDGSGRQVLPAIYGDNYFTLLPAEEKTVVITWKPEDADGKCRVEISGTNVPLQN